MINGSLSGPILKVNTDGDDSYGVYAYTTGYDSEGFYAYTTGEDSEGFYAETFGDYSEGVNARTAGNGSEGVNARTTGYDSPAVYGYSKQDVGVYGKGKEGGYFTTTMAGSVSTAGFYPLAGVNVSTAYDWNPGVYVHTTGEDSDGVNVDTAGDYSTGVRVTTDGNGSAGVRVTTDGEYSGGFYAYTTGEGSDGVNVDTAGDYSTGFYVETDGKGSKGFYARTLGNGSDGFYARTSGDRSGGVYVKTSGDDSDGVSAYTKGDDSHGVRADTSGNDSHGVQVITSGNGSDGVRVLSWDGYGVYARGKKAGIYAEGILGGYAAEFDGRTTTKVLEITGGSDLSEQFEIRGIEAEMSPSPGMVVSIDPERPGELVVSNEAYDRRVAGIISGAGGLNPGMLMGQNGSDADGGYPVALSGRVYCWADASKGPIEPGDLLTTSETPGHAMKVTDHDRADGAIIGKAMTGLEEGKGLVLVLVALQ